MCGRFTLRTPLNLVAEQFFITLPGVLADRPRFNIAPSQPILAVHQPSGGESRQGVMLQWGLIPSWAKDPTIGNRMINARSETAHQKPSFRAAFKNRRCLVLADGFYEWQKLPNGKQAWYFHRPDHQPFAFAGLWESWHGPGQQQELQSATILTTTPNECARPVHDRMPVILSEQDHDAWLDPDNPDLDAVGELMGPCPADQLACTAVSSHVNSPRHDDQQCIAEVPIEQELF
jgi:putative SOS response-associated peptidase YedK